MVTEGYIEVQEGRGKKLRTREQTVEATDVHVEGVFIVDSEGNIKDPTQIRLLTSSDVVTINPDPRDRSWTITETVTITPDPRDRNWTISETLSVTGTVNVEQSDETKLKATVTQASIDRTISSLPDVDIGDISKGTQTHDVKITLDSETVTVVQSTASNLKAEVTQSAKDREITDISKTTSPITITTTDASDKLIKDPSAGKKFRVKFIYVWNKSGADRSIDGFKFGSGSYHFPSKLGDKTGYGMNVVGANFEGAVDENLVFKANGANVVVTISGEEI